MSDLLNQAIGAFNIGNLAEARKLCLAVLKTDNRNVVALHLGAVLEAQHGNPDRAIQLFERALKINPNSADLLADKGKVLSEAGRHGEALPCYEQALAINPAHGQALHNLATSLFALKRPADAIAAFDRLIASGEAPPSAFNNRGLALAALGRFEEAGASYRQALQRNANDAEIWSNLGISLDRARLYGEAVAAYDRALALKPDFGSVLGARFFSKLHICDWRDFEADRAALIASVRDGKPSVTPFSFVAVPSSPQDQLQCATAWTTASHPPAKPLWRGQSYRHDRIRVAYLSADFHQHAVGYIIAGMLECHDRSRFGITAVSFGPDDNSGLRRRLTSAVEDFVDASAWSDDAVAAHLRECEIDIAVDLSGHTLGGRTGVFARRPAPLQVNYLGFPGSMGASYMDYIVADRTVIPEADRPHYSEKVIWLPNSYQANDSKAEIAAKVFSREELGLPPQAFVFCCFNNNFKITPNVFDSWMRILGRVEGSVLWLYEDNAAAADNLRREAGARGVDPQRLVFAGKMPLPEHLARHRAADLFLDTLPYNAHATASVALWAGLPLLTRPGETFAGRVAAGLLAAIGLPDLIAATADAYEAIAVDLATDPGKLAAIRSKLAANRLSSPLFDTPRFTRDLEAAYAAIHARQAARLPPDHIAVGG